ncbi:hypothetical protein [Novosphingobium album (ex Liu et al. 2023)]|uniref:hypothetical protein n=1 Tax=Novosphingobium album (ex Liu et al. 2023) TaxID=3031130 RepID=UPI0023B098FC|nr:hypothetical protein [Novosphingobium album (ex Liu et al. 2023)]
MIDPRVDALDIHSAEAVARAILHPETVFAVVIGIDSRFDMLEARWFPQHLLDLSYGGAIRSVPLREAMETFVALFVLRSLPFMLNQFASIYFSLFRSCVLRFALSVSLGVDDHLHDSASDDNYY